MQRGRHSGEPQVDTLIHHGSHVCAQHGYAQAGCNAAHKYYGLAVTGPQNSVSVPIITCRLHMQANEGENKTERPMWAEKGGLDFEGRARWDAWTANKGMASDKAKLLFVKVRHGPVACRSDVERKFA